MEKEIWKATKPVTYYGKKVYRINPLIARTKPVERKGPVCRYEDVDSPTKLFLAAKKEDLRCNGER